MTESKRFQSDGWSITDGEHRIGMIQATKLLNELAEENKQLKNELQIIRQRETVQKLNAIENSTMEQFLKKQKR